MTTFYIALAILGAFALPMIAPNIQQTVEGDCSVFIGWAGEGK